MRALWTWTTALAATAALAACGTYTEGETLAAGADPNRLECRTLVQPGTNIGQRYCATLAEWDAYENDRRSDTQEALRRFIQRAAVAPAGDPNPLAP